DPVAVRVAQERSIVRRVIIARTRRTVVGAAGGNAGVPERVHLGAPLRLEAPVAAEGFLGLRALADGEIDAVRVGRARPLAVTEPVVAAADLDDFERLHDRVVEALGGGDIGNGDGDVVQHQSVLDDDRDCLSRHYEERSDEAIHTSSRHDGLLRCACNDGAGGYDAFFSRSSASCSFAFRSTAASRFSFSSSTISSGAFATNFSFPSLASTRLMSASALAISLSSRALSAERSMTPFSGSATTSPRTSNCTAPSGGRSAKEISTRRARRFTVSFQRWARSLVSVDAPDSTSGINVAGGMFISERTERMAVTRSTTQPISASAAGSLKSSDLTNPWSRAAI